MNHVLDQVIRAGSAGRDSDGDIPGGKPLASFYLSVLMLVVMLNQFVRNHLRRVFDEVGRQLGFPHFGEMRSVGRVISANYQQKIERVLQKLFQGILPVLSSTADRVKKP